MLVFKHKTMGLQGLEERQEFAVVGLRPTDPQSVYFAVRPVDDNGVGVLIPGACVSGFVNAEVAAVVRDNINDLWRLEGAPCDDATVANLVAIVAAESGLAIAA